MLLDNGGTAIRGGTSERVRLAVLTNCGPGAAPKRPTR